MNEWPEKFLHADRVHEPYPRITASRSTCTAQTAYAIQQAYVELRNEPIAGYKAALTATQAQNALRTDEPIMGALFKHCEYKTTESIALKRAALLETEIGYRTAVSITAPVTEAHVLDLFTCCHSMIEIASPNLAGPINLVDLIATNSASYGFIVGQPCAINDIQLDELSVELHRGNEVLLSGKSAEVLNGQRSALVWLINETLKQGYAIEPGQIFMSGSIGGMAAAKPGIYRACFGSLKPIEFTITAA